ncbi:MAG: flap endonuclease-1 [Candidatus Nanohaloarchaeota archaeon QJJ-9]|nr:flap endonuclease-1 [Candidatus Nanohaloarchaeota archaeon QJJ-9]
MGTDFGELIEPEEISFDHMFNKTVAIDAMNTLYQFLSIIRQSDGTPLKDSSGNVTSHLSGIFYRNTKLLKKNIKPVYVYDGEAPDLKSKEAKERRKKREKARKEWEKLKEKGKEEEAYKKATQGSKLTSEMIKESKKLLDAMGIPYVQAPSEGEAQAAYIQKEGYAWAVGSQDWDCLLFGAERLAKNLTITGKRKISGKKAYKKVVPEKVELEKVLDSLGITYEKLIWMGILIGTDFNPGGVKGIGPKTAEKLVKEYEGFGKLLSDEKVEWEHDNSPEEILKFFKSPPIKEEIKIEHGGVDREKLKEFLVEKHDFSEKRVESTLKKLEKSRKESQDDLENYF